MLGSNNFLLNFSQLLGKSSNVSQHINDHRLLTVAAHEYAYASNKWIGGWSTNPCIKQLLAVDAKKIHEAAGAQAETKIISNMVKQDHCLFISSICTWTRKKDQDFDTYGILNLSVSNGVPV